MGYLRHECIVVSGWNAEAVCRAHAAASGIFDAASMGSLVGGLIHHAINGGAAFLIAPDGSKEGWEHSDKADAARTKFIAWMRSRKDEYGVDWALLLMGGDDGEFRVQDHCTADETEESI